MFYVEVETRFRDHFGFKHRKHILNAPFVLFVCDLKNEVAHYKGTFSFQLIPINPHLRMVGENPNYSKST